MALSRATGSQILPASKFPGHSSRIALLRIDGVIHLPHFVIGNFSAEHVQSPAQLRMVAKRAAPKNRHSLIRRKEVAVVLQDDHAERDDEAVRGTPRDDVHLMLLERPIKQTQVHDAWRGSELESIRAREAGVPV